VLYKARSFSGLLLGRVVAKLWPLLPKQAANKWPQADPKERPSAGTLAVLLPATVAPSTARVVQQNGEKKRRKRQESKRAKGRTFLQKMPKQIPIFQSEICPRRRLSAALLLLSGWKLNVRLARTPSFCPHNPQSTQSTIHSPHSQPAPDYD